MPSPGETQRVPDCPRCGYDLSGETERWDTLCPTDGVCPECGLAFHWGDVLTDRRPLPWSFEHHDRVSFFKLLRTMLVTMRPKRLWNGLSMSQPIRLRRLLVLAIAPLLVTHLVLGCVGVAIQHAGGVWTDPYQHVLLWPYWRWLAVGGYYTSVPGFLPWWLIPPLGMGLGMLVMGASMRRAKARRAHILRAVAHAVPPAVLHSTFAGLVYAAIPAMWWTPWIPKNVVTEKILSTSPLWLGALYVFWLGGWWARFVGEYLRMEQPRRVALAMTALGGLTLLTAFAHTFPAYFASMLGL